MHFEVAQGYLITANIILQINFIKLTGNSKMIFNYPWNIIMLMGIGVTYFTWMVWPKISGSTSEISRYTDLYLCFTDSSLAVSLFTKLTLRPPHHINKAYQLYSM